MKWQIQTAEKKLNHKIESLCKWHRWFAWRPVIVTTDDAVYRVWLGYVGRRLMASTYATSSVDTKVVIGSPEYCEVEDLIVKMLVEDEPNDKRRKK